jgi:chromosome partitioning protein
MSSICFASLKGGVGKTSLSLNVAHALAVRGCQTLLIDFDPTAHATRFFRNRFEGDSWPHEAALTRSLIGDDPASEEASSLIIPVRPQLDLLPGGSELRYLMWGRGARAFCTHFARLFAELKSEYDYIIFDTAPEYNVLTRNAIALSALVAMPVDSSEMSIYALEELLESASHIKGPSWVIIRSMVSKAASRIHQLSQTRLGKNMNLRPQSELEPEGEEALEGEEEQSDDLFSYLEECADINGIGGGTSARNGNGHRTDPQVAGAVPRPGAAPSSGVVQRARDPIYLLNSVVYRTEIQNRLSFLGKTAFEDRSADKLAAQYLSLAKELEQLLSLVTEQESEPIEGFFEAGLSPA